MVLMGLAFSVFPAFLCFGVILVGTILARYDSPYLTLAKDNQNRDEDRVRAHDRAKSPTKRKQKNVIQEYSISRHHARCVVGLWWPWWETHTDNYEMFGSHLPPFEKDNSPTRGDINYWQALE
jgi:hypothetical protein